MPSSARKSKAEKNHLFVLPSGNVINNNEEGREESKYLNRLPDLLGEGYEVTFIKYPKRRTELYSSAYFKRKAAMSLAAALDKAEGEKAVLLGISAGADVIMKYLAGSSKNGISKAICIGLFTGVKRRVKVGCGELIFLYGGNDLVGITHHNETVVLTPEEYAPSCIKNITSLHSNTTITYKIIAGCSHTLLPEKRKRPELILKQLITDE